MKSLHFTYLETSKRAKARWSAQNREHINAKRRARRLQARLTLLEGKKCLNCEVLLSKRLDWSPGRSYLYCRKCITTHKPEVGRDKWRRYYYRKTGGTPRVKPKEKTILYKRPLIEECERKDYTIEMDFKHFRDYKVGPTKSTIHICPCGNRYVRTRDNQLRCLPCIAYCVV